ncbi:hypothetical protein L195_g048840, partial [Trifolium pratense]
MEDMERKFVFAEMLAKNAKNAEHVKKLYEILASLTHKGNPIEKPPYDIAVIGLGTIIEEKPPSHVGIEANLNGV